MDVDIDALVERVVINGVDVTAYVNERDPWYPLRAMIRRDTDPDGLRVAWAALEAEWATTIERARALPEAAPYESVGGEWSFVQTVRHLVFAMDMWFTAPVSGEGLHPMGLPDSGSSDFPWPDLDPSLSPSLEEALAVRADRARHFRTFLDDLATADLDREVDVLGPAPIRCANASSRSSKRSSGTFATRGATSSTSRRPSNRRPMRSP